MAVETIIETVTLAFTNEVQVDDLVQISQMRGSGNARTK